MNRAKSDSPWHVSVDGRDAVAIADPSGLDLVRAPDGSYSYLSPAGKSHRVEVEHVDLRSRLLTLKVDGRRHRLALRNPLDQLIETLGMEAEPKPVLTEVRAPMPGLVLRVAVEDGQEVAPGDTLLVLEAMKMENAIKASAAGRVKQVAVRSGDAVEKGALLIAF